MGGCKCKKYNNDGYPLQLMTEKELAEIRRSAVNEYKQQQEREMAKEPNSAGMNRHKRMAMGETVELKKGGHVKKAVKKAEAKKKK